MPEDVKAVVFDTGPLDRLEEREVLKFFTDLAKTRRIRLMVPTVVIAEYLSKFSRGDVSSGDQVLRIFKPLSVDESIGRKAAEFGRLVTRRSDREGPSVVDLIVCAAAQINDVHLVVTNDRADFEAIRATGAAIQVLDVSELLP